MINYQISFSFDMWYVVNMMKLKNDINFITQWRFHQCMVALVAIILHLSGATKVYCNFKFIVIPTKSKTIFVLVTHRACQMNTFLYTFTTILLDRLQILSCDIIWCTSLVRLVFFICLYFDTEYKHSISKMKNSYFELRQKESSKNNRDMFILTFAVSVTTPPCFHFLGILINLSGTPIGRTTAIIIWKLCVWTLVISIIFVDEWKHTIFSVFIFVTVCCSTFYKKNNEKLTIFR